ncbi:hypothetical protein [Streptomyces sp. NPDC127197]
MSASPSVRPSHRIDDHGKPFRTSGSRGRPLYEYPVGGTEGVGVAED